MVRDNLRRKMSKSLGNSPDPLDLIRKFGADGVRVGMLLCSPAGGDLLFDESLPQQGSGFATKIWNAFRLVKNWEVSDKIDQPENSKLAIEWFSNKLNQVIQILNGQFEQFRISEALMTIYTTVRDEFSGWLLEIVKPPYKSPVDKKTYNEVIELFDKLLRLMHPFMPFITEEIWQLLKERASGESIMVSRLPQVSHYEEELLYAFENVKEAVSGIRTVRKNNGIPNKEMLTMKVQPGDKGYEPSLEVVIKKLGNLSHIELTDKEEPGAASFMVKSSNFYLSVNSSVNTDEEKKRLKEELKYARGFLNSVMKKLNNDKFVANAPQSVVDREKAKQSDAEAKIKILEERIASIK
jgi:valyl-tRNA synthetase